MGSDEATDSVDESMAAIGRFITSFSQVVFWAEAITLSFKRWGVKAPKLRDRATAGLLRGVHHAASLDHLRTTEHLKHTPEVVDAVSSEFQQLIDQRNRVLHDAWRVTYEGMSTYRRSDDGIDTREWTVAELDALSLRCQHLTRAMKAMAGIGDLLDGGAVQFSSLTLADGELVVMPGPIYR